MSGSKNRQHRVRGTDIKVDATGRRHNDIVDPGPGEHLWMIMTAHRISDPARAVDQVNLDLESLLTIEGPGCYKCEQPWRPGLETTRCNGSMDLMQSEGVR